LEPEQALDKSNNSGSDFFPDAQVGDPGFERNLPTPNIHRILPIDVAGETPEALYLFRYDHPRILGDRTLLKDSSEGRGLLIFRAGSSGDIQLLDQFIPHRVHITAALTLSQVFVLTTPLILNWIWEPIFISAMRLPKPHPPWLISVMKTTTCPFDHNGFSQQSGE
jgi:hypothetical protein